LIVEGPAWSASGLRVGAGKYPLAVEQPVMARAARLVPGVTTVTPHARYFAVHGLVMAEVRARGLERAEAQDLMRRTEVALAAVSFAHHGGHDSPLGRAHGTDILAQQLRDGTLDLEEVSAAGKGGYVGASWGFSGAYVGSEMTVGVLGAGREPGPACDEALLRRSLGGLLELAGQDQIRIADLTGYVDLCICAGAGAEDGDWFAALLCGTDTRASDTTATQRRRETIQLIARIVDTHRVSAVTRDVGAVLAFGDFLLEDEIARSNNLADEWRGLVLRNHMVSAWRRLWAWLVDAVSELTHIDDVVAAQRASRGNGRFVSGFIAAGHACLRCSGGRGGPSPGGRRSGEGPGCSCGERGPDTPVDR
jgi:hypothetical protein